MTHYGEPLTYHYIANRWAFSTANLVLDLLPISTISSNRRSYAKLGESKSTIVVHLVGRAVVFESVQSQGATLVVWPSSLTRVKVSVLASVL